MVAENENLSYSKQGLQLTEDFEGFRDVAYQDQGGRWTCGYGHTGHDVYAGVTCTREQAELWLMNDVQTAENTVKHLVTVPLTQGEFDSLTDFCFNIGSGNFLKSTVLRKLNANDKHAASVAFMMWDKVAGQVSKGLARRRLSEEELFGHLDQAA